MFHTEEKPPEQPRENSMRLIRAPSKGELKVCITTPKIVGTRNHFFGGRTSPCMLGQCEACEAGTPWRWTAYLAAITMGANEHVIIEVPAAAAKTIADYREENGSLRGTKMTLFRIGNRPNGRVMVHLAPANLGQTTLPRQPDVVAFLCHLWNVPIAANDAPPERGTMTELRPTNFAGQKPFPSNGLV